MKKTRKEKEEYNKLKSDLIEINKDSNDYVIFENEIIHRSSRDAKIKEKREAVASILT